MWMYTWDPDEPRLTRVQGPGGVDVAYTYDHRGRMLTRTSGGVTSLMEWDQWDLVKETTGATVTRYVIPEGQLHSFERGGNTYQVHCDDHNVSVRAITDASGTVVAHYEFDAWGNQLGSSSGLSGGLAYGFAGGIGIRFDSTTGLYFARERWYDPVLARFISRDILDANNRYAFCHNNPVNHVDPTGLDPITTTDPMLGDVINSMRADPNYKAMMTDLEGEKGLSYLISFGGDKMGSLAAATGSSPKEDLYKMATFLNPVFKENKLLLSYVVAHELYHAWIAKKYRNNNCDHGTIWEELAAEKFAQAFYKKLGGTRQAAVEFEKKHPGLDLDFGPLWDVLNNKTTKDQKYKAANDHWNSKEMVDRRKGYVKPNDPPKSQKIPIGTSPLTPKF